MGVCLFQQGRRVLKAVAPAAGSCGPQPCWTGSGTDFDYVDPDGTPDRIRRIVTGSDGLKAAARGNELATSAQGLPDPLFSGSPGPAIPLPPIRSRPSRRGGLREGRARYLQAFL